MDSQQFKEAAASAVDEIIQYYDTIHERRVVSDVEPGYLKKILPDGPPQEGESWPDIQKDIETKIMPGLTHWQHPNFMAFFPAITTYPSMLGELYSAAFMAPAFNWMCSPAVTELETIVMDWMAKLLNLPGCYLSSTEGGGVIQGSASEALVTVMVAARDKYLRETTAGLSGIELEDAIAYKRGKLVALGSEMVHSCTQKATQIVGVRFRSVPVLASNDFAMTGDDLQVVLDECKAQGLEPFFITATLGTTATCAVDDFKSIATVLSKHAPPDAPNEIWAHVDAAYAAFPFIRYEYAQMAPGQLRCVMSLYQKRKHLIDALSITPSYLRNEFSEKGLVTDYRDWQIPLGRRFRSLKIWFVLRSYGVRGMQEHIRRHIKLGELFAGLVKTRKDLFNIVTGPNFALTVLTIVPKSAGIDAQNSITKDVYELINKRGEILLTSSVVQGTYVIRVVSANEKAEEKYVRRAFEILVETTEELRDGKAVNGKAVNGKVNGVVTNGKAE